MKNIAELLRNCPRGMELDCTMFDDVKFIAVDDAEKPICIRTGVAYRFLTKFGTWTFDENAKCVIFPKGKTSWEGFVPPCQFKDGDVLVVNNSDGKKKACFENIFILNKPESYGKWHSYCHLDGVGRFHSKETYLAYDKDNPRFATEEEKQKLFDSIKANGYKWNAGTKTLDELIKPKFKVGDKVRNKRNHDVVFTITSLEEDYYACGVVPVFWFYDQNDYELIPNKFDIGTLKPFDKVLIRDGNKQRWGISFFGYHNESSLYKHYCVNNTCWQQCIPYEGNEYLVGTTNDCDDFYKTWE